MTTGGANYRLFWQEFRRTFNSTGALLPSGPRLCRELAHYVGVAAKPQRVLEVGPGTGVVTDEIIGRLGPEDTLDIVELNDRFVEALRARLSTDPRWRQAAARIAIHHLPIEQLSTEAKYDTIVSGLPLNNFPVEVVRNILGHLEQLAAPQATLSFFEYVAIRRVKGIVSSAAERQRLAGIAAALNDVLGERQIRRKCVLANVPPAWAHHLRF